ncbi:UNKNOWN [Stylonychia lemnae]|uniref:Uncharacterized protein n=1 Tax=Stylonychia lemnae TaxID=5949 RepID=A0A078A012_STYLE|nr:UNKNOWN [Stylonychia lemnae]|eukprot:CDW74118.1 UNKNOWN [Stylonychia lemnae]
MSNFNSRSFTIEGGHDGEIALDILNEDLKDLSLKDAIIDLYLNVKIRNSEDIDNYNQDMLKEEKEQLKDIDPFIIIEYIKSSIEILLSLKLEEQERELKKGKQQPENKPRVATNFKSGDASSIVDFFSDQSSCRIEPPQEYENQIQKLENDVRNHIRIEQQLKIHLDNVLQKIEDQEKQQLIDHTQNQERIKELKKDKERLEELLSLRDRELSDFKRKYENFDLNLVTENQNLQKKIVQMEAEYNTKILNLQKELDDARNQLRSVSEKRSSQLQTMRTFDNIDEGEDMFSLRKKIPDGTDTLALMERLNELSKFKSMKEMMKIKNEQIKFYRDSFQKIKSKSPSKYQSSENQNSQLLQNSNSQGSLSNLTHKRSQSQNMTAINIKPQTANQDGQKNLIQQYNNYINLKQGNSRTTGQMSLNMTQSMPTGHSTDNLKFLMQQQIQDEYLHDHILANQNVGLQNSNFMNLYLGAPPNLNQGQQQQQSHASQTRQNNLGNSGTTAATYNSKKIISSKQQHQNYSMALNSSGSNTGRGASSSNLAKNKINKASYNELQKQLSQSNIRYSNNITNQHIPTKHIQGQQPMLQQSQSQYIKPITNFNQTQQIQHNAQQQHPIVVMSGAMGVGSQLQGLNPIVNSKAQNTQLKKKKLNQILNENAGSSWKSNLMSIYDQSSSSLGKTDNQFYPQMREHSGQYLLDKDGVIDQIQQFFFQNIQILIKIYHEGKISLDEEVYQYDPKSRNKLKYFINLTLDYLRHQILVASQQLNIDTEFDEVVYPLKYGYYLIREDQYIKANELIRDRVKQLQYQAYLQNQIDYIFDKLNVHKKENLKVIEIARDRFEDLISQIPEIQEKYEWNLYYTGQVADGSLTVDIKSFDLTLEIQTEQKESIDFEYILNLIKWYIDKKYSQYYKQAEVLHTREAIILRLKDTASEFQIDIQINNRETSYITKNYIR